MMSAMSMSLMLFGQYMPTPKKFISPLDTPDDGTEVELIVIGKSPEQVTILPLRGEEGYA